jgi:cytochrome c553
MVETLVKTRVGCHQVEDARTALWVTGAHVAMKDERLERAESANELAKASRHCTDARRLDISVEVAEAIEEIHSATQQNEDKMAGITTILIACGVCHGDSANVPEGDFVCPANAELTQDILTPVIITPRFGITT